MAFLAAVKPKNRTETVAPLVKTLARGDDAAAIASKVRAELEGAAGQKLDAAVSSALRGVSHDVLVREASHVIALQAMLPEAHLDIGSAMAKRLGNVLGRAVAAERHVELTGQGAFRWVFDAHVNDGSAQNHTSRVARFFATTPLDASSVPTVLWEGMPAGAGLTLTQRRLALDEAQEQILAVRMRSVNAALFSPAALDIADAARELANASLEDIARAPRAGKSIEVKPLVLTQSWDTLFKEELSEIALADENGVPRLRCVVEHAQAINGQGSTVYDNVFHIVVPVGDYGATLASAIVEASRLMMDAAGKVGVALGKYEAPTAAANDLVFNKNMASMMREGIATHAHALGLLLATRAQGDLSVDELLIGVRDSGLIPQLAMAAPFGVVGPLAALGFVPTDGITFSERGRARLPESLNALCKESRDARWHGSTKRQTETLRGCPVATRAPAATAAGLAMPDHSALHELSGAFIDLVRKTYATMQSIQPSH